MDRPSNCCTTSSIINTFSRCFCIRPPDYKKISIEQREKLEAQAVHEIIAQKLFYQEQNGPRSKKVMQQSSIPRVPLKVRLNKHTPDPNKPRNSAVTMRPITMLSGTSKHLRDRKPRSVSVWARERRSRASSFQDYRSSILRTACEEHKIPLR